MNELQTFPFDFYRTIRVRADENGNPWFVAKDLCEILDISNSRDAFASLDDGEKGVVTADTPGGPQNLSAVSESGLYSLIFRSRKPEARDFRRWVTAEVIPSIRKHGAYLTERRIEEALCNPDTLIRLATELKSERAGRLRLEDEHKKNLPKIVFAESIETARTSILIGEMAKLICQSTGADLGQNRFFQYLREHGYLHTVGEQRNLPTQRSIESGWMEIKETVIENAGQSFISRTPKITGSGQVYFLNLFKKSAGELVNS